MNLSLRTWLDCLRAVWLPGRSGKRSKIPARHWAYSWAYRGLIRAIS